MKKERKLRPVGHTLTDEEYAEKISKLRNRRNEHFVKGDDEAKNYFYFRVLGDHSSSKIMLSRREVYAIEDKLPAIVKKDLVEGNHSKRADEDLGMLLSFSYSVLGGVNPCIPASKGSPYNHYGDKPKWYVPMKYQYDYKSFFIEETIKLLKNSFDPERSWGYYSRFAVSKAISKTIRLMQKDQEFDDFSKNSAYLEEEVMRRAYNQNDLFTFL